MRKTLALALIATAAAAQADNDYEPQMRAYLADHLSNWIEAPVLVEAIKAQNARNAALTQDQIATLDKAWTAEVGKPDMPTIAPVMKNPAADFLRQQMAGSGGAILEAFVMDDKGLNVAVSAPTSDYWQGDEPKWQKTYAAGAGAVEIGKVDFDESTQTYEAQISTTIVDPATHQPIGAITVGLNIEALK